MAFNLQAPGLADLEGILLKGLKPEDHIEQQGRLTIIKRLADYKSLFAPMQNKSELASPLSDHAPLIYQDILSYNMLCPGSPGGLLTDDNQHLVETRDYTSPNNRALTNFSLIEKWVGTGSIAIVQEVSLAFEQYITQSMKEQANFQHQRTKGNQFYQATFYNKSLYEPDIQQAKKLQERLALLHYNYRRQHGRILVSYLRPKTTPLKENQLILNAHLLPGGRNPKKLEDFKNFVQQLIDTLCTLISFNFKGRIILAGDMNNEPGALAGISLPKGWQGTLVYAPNSSQSWRETGPHLATNDLILILAAK